MPQLIDISGSLPAPGNNRISFDQRRKARFVRFHAFIRVCEALAARKASMRHGQWIAAIERNGLERTRIARLVAIGLSPNFKNYAAPFEAPLNRSALYELSRLNHERYRWYVLDDYITPFMSGAAARRLVRDGPVLTSFAHLRRV